MAEVIRIGGLELRFVATEGETGGSLTMFEMTVAPNARMPVPHYHENWDEAVYGLEGETAWRVGGKDITLRAGESLFIPRGVVHGFDNGTQAPGKCLCIITPGVLGPAYFREIAALVASPPPDLAKMKETMLRYGLVPVPPGQGAT
ncbi:cupin domain protein [Acetobacteraceae bacterium AT-5844]|nr:cupin domain protein [Acetobacteraceae bacterium AT-5844]